MQVIVCEQGSQEWHQARRGVPTASNFDKVLTTKTRKPSGQQGKYIAQLIGDLMSPYYPERADSFMNRAMQWGADTEHEARKWYALEQNTDVEQVGFCVTDDGRFGCSPDGLVGIEGGLELKCPLPATQAEYLLDGCLPSEYLHQVHGSLIVTGRAWWDFMSYAVGMPPLLVRVTPCAYTEALKAELERFWDRYQAALKKIRGEP